MCCRSSRLGGEPRSAGSPRKVKYLLSRMSSASVCVWTLAPRSLPLGKRLGGVCGHPEYPLDSNQMRQSSFSLATVIGQEIHFDSGLSS